MTGGGWQAPKEPRSGRVLGKPLDKCFPRDAAGEMCSVIKERVWLGWYAKEIFFF